MVTRNIKDVAPDSKILVNRIAEEGTLVEYRKGRAIFRQGEPEDAIFAIQKGRVKLTVVSKQSKEAVIAILTPGDLLGESCLVGAAHRLATATALADCSIARLSRKSMLRMIHEDPAVSEAVLSYVLHRNIRIQEDLVDQLFNSSEKRLARVLLLLANFGKEDRPELVIPKISQETLAEIIGTTRSRVSFFMNKFRRLGFVKYNGELEVHSSLLNVILHD
jgi:CRP-like cAMP-binding protein